MTVRDDIGHRVDDLLGEIEAELGEAPEVEDVARFYLTKVDALRTEIGDLRNANRDLADLHAEVERDLLEQIAPTGRRPEVDGYDLIVQRAILRGQLRQAEVRADEIMDGARALVWACKAWVRANQDLAPPLERQRTVDALADAVDALDPLLGLEGTR